MSPADTIAVAVAESPGEEDNSLQRVIRTGTDTIPEMTTRKEFCSSRSLCDGLWRGGAPSRDASRSRVFQADIQICIGEQRTSVRPNFLACFFRSRRWLPQ